MRGRPKKVKITEPKEEIKSEKPKEILDEEGIVIFDNSPKAQLEERLKFFYDLRATMVGEGVDSLGKLDNLIAEVIKQLK